MLFVFRGIRRLQAFLAAIALGAGISCVIFLEHYTSDKSALSIVLALVFGVIFLWGFATALRAPTSFVAVADNRTRIRFAGFVDTVVDNRNIVSARLVNHRWYAGIGVRTNFGGQVSLVSSSGEVCELTMRQPIRVWLIPKLLPLKARQLRLSVRNPQKLVERFGGVTASSPSPSPSARPARKMKQQRRR